MMAMTRDLNAKVQAATGKPANETTRVECVTCHRGVAIPQPLSAIILRTIAQKGGAAAVEQYLDLRKQFYSRATYDFSEDALLEMVQRVVQGRPDDAIALLRMNLEFNPQSAKTYALIGFAYTRKVDDASAITNLQKSLELDPTNAMVRGQLEQLQEYRRAGGSNRAECLLVVQRAAARASLRLAARQKYQCARCVDADDNAADLGREGSGIFHINDRENRQDHE